MDWEAEGLLEDVEGERAREARRRLLDELHQEGVPLEELRRAVAEDRLALLPVERLLTAPPELSARDVSERSGMDLEYFLASRRALGFPVPDPDEHAFNEEDVDTARLGSQYMNAGFALEETIEVTRVLGQGMARYAEALRAMAAHAFLEPGIDERELARRYEAVAKALLPTIAPWLDHVFRLHLRQVLREDAVTREQLESGRVDESRKTAVAFADLVGFTALGETVQIEELTGVAGKLANLAERLTDSPVHVVKQIGDAVMLVSSEVDPMIETVLRLVDAADADDTLPSLRAGVAYGPAVSRWGDWFGPTVNVASRLTERARPDSVLATEAVREESRNGYTWSSAGPKKLKGLTSPLKTYRVRRGDDDA
jgi:adenylate cyclase